MNKVVYNTLDTPVPVDDEGTFIDGLSYKSVQSTEDAVKNGIENGWLVEIKSDEVQDDTNPAAVDAMNENNNPAWLDNILNDLLIIAHKALAEDPQHVHRYAWPMRIALLKVRDPIHQDWLQQQIARASILLSNVGIPPQSAGEPVRPEDLFAKNA